MIVITGAAGFIASCLVSKLNELGFNDLMIVDDFSPEKKKVNWEQKKFVVKSERKDFLLWFEKNHSQVEFVFHLGARTDTTETNQIIFDELNLNYSKTIWKICTRKDIPLIYASSAATYGSGEFGYEDDHELIFKLKPLNPYGVSKNEFDKWALTQDHPPFWAGLKFFNVYGPNEYHKGRMASVIFHAYHQIKETGKIRLFKSHLEKYADGAQMRDFIYVKDVVDAMIEMFRNKINSGIYDLGTGKARTFNDLAKAVFAAMNLPTNIEYIDMPADIQNTYQYFTQAEVNKLKQTDLPFSPSSLEDGVLDYVQHYLALDHKVI